MSLLKKKRKQRNKEKWQKYKAGDYVGRPNNFIAVAIIFILLFNIT